MAITWATLKTEIQQELHDETDFADGGNLNYLLLVWANRAVRYIHQQIDMFYKLKTGGSDVTFTITDFSKALPTWFFKKSDRFTYVKKNDTVIPIIGLDELNAIDSNHNDTTSNTYPENVAIEGTKIFTYPLFAGTIKVEGYFEAPTDMTTGASNPDIADSDDALAQELIIALVLRKAFSHLLYDDKTAYYSTEAGGLLELYRTHIKKTDSKKVNKLVYY